VSQPATRTYEDSAPTTGIELIAVAQGILAAVVNYFTANGVPLPDRQYIAAGSPQVIAWDCEQLVVSLADIGWGRSVDATQLSPSFGKQAGINAMRHATFAIQLVRATPVVQDGAEAPILPSVQAMADAGQTFLVDAGLLSQALVNFVAFPNGVLPIGCNVQAGAIQPIGPEGGLVGLEGSLVMTAATLASVPGSDELPPGFGIRNGSPGGGL
jgi:hypothetical protein